MTAAAGAPPRLDDAERRRRLVTRHHLHGTAPDVPSAVAAVGALHSSDPVTPVLAVRARVAGATVADVDAALYDDRTLWRLHAMRRTLWVARVRDVPELHAATSRRVHGAELRRAAGWLADEGVAAPTARLVALGGDVRALLSDGVPRTAREVTAAVPGLADRLRGGSTSLGSRVLFLEALAGGVVRTAPAGGWTSSQYAWTTSDTWFGPGPGEALEVAEPGAAVTGLVRRHLRACGPATRDDVRWWTGLPARDVDAAARALHVTTVVLERGEEAWVLPDDVAPTPPPAGGVALLPGLDPSVMAWKDRGWLLGAHADRLFDRNGNAGPTVLVDGAVVGGWATDPDGVVVHDADVAVADVDAAAAVLTAWLDGTALRPRFPSPASRALAGG